MQEYLIDPTGWAIQSDFAFTSGYPGCGDKKRALKLEEAGAGAATRRNVLMIAIDDMRPELGPCECHKLVIPRPCLYSSSPLSTD